MSAEQGFCKAAGLEQGVAQQDRITHATPDGRGYVVAGCGDALHQHGIDAHADHNEEGLEAQGQQELRATVDFLRQYTLTHFLHEEALQLDHNYPDYPNHKRLHESFLKTVEDLSNRLYAQGPTTDLVAEINKRLAGWLLNHIKTEDARVARHIQTRTS